MIKLYEYIIDQEQLNTLFNFYSNMLIPSEFNTNQKTIINGFIRMYQDQQIEWENQNKFKKHYSKVEKNYQKDKEIDIKKRLEWLQPYLISSEQFFNSKQGQTIVKQFNSNYKPFIQKGFDKASKQFLHEYQSLVIILLFYGFKLMYPNVNIDQKLIEQFKIFRFRDN